MKKLKRAIACTNTLTILYDEDGAEKTTGIWIDVANMVVTSKTFATDISDAEQFAREKKIPELTIIPYSPIYRNGYGDDCYLVGAADALRFYRGDDVDEMMKKLAPFFPQPYQPDLSLKVIDFDLLGNQAILYLGKPDIESYDGDGWDDAPYEFYADKVDGTYIADAIVLNFPSDVFVYQASAYRDACPELGLDGSVSKNTLHRKKIPCILYSQDGETYGEIHFDDVIGDVMKEADVLVSKLKHLA